MKVSFFKIPPNIKSLDSLLIFIFNLRFCMKVLLFKILPNLNFEVNGIASKSRVKRKKYNQNMFTLEAILIIYTFMQNLRLKAKYTIKSCKKFDNKTS